MKKEREIPIGTIRIGKDLKVYEKSSSFWRLCKKDFPYAIQVIKLFKKNERFSELIDKQNPNFLKGQVYKEKIQGSRINILPDGQILGGSYSLFAEHLTIHDQSSSYHWDVIYKNPNGKFAYLYTMDKKSLFQNDKYKKVRKFEEKYPLLLQKVSKALKQGDYMALPIYTLLKTHMRVGNEVYYRAHGHKGLTTLKKENLRIKGNSVNFKYLGKDGVPQNMTKEFSEAYLVKLGEVLSQIKNEDFVFKSPSGNLLHEKDFKLAFERYIGEGFYPHIVRSYFATRETQEFLKKNKKLSKDEVMKFLFKVAEELGHKKFSKKTNQWEDSYSVTIGHYISPKFVEKLRKFLK